MSICDKFKTFNKIPFQPREDQLDVTRYFNCFDINGLVVFWSLGTGKTCLAILISDSNIRKFDKIFVLTPGSLRENFQSQYCLSCGKYPAELDKKFVFITYNNTRLKSLPNMDRSLIIIDEAHNIIRGKMNAGKFKEGSETSSIYETIYDHLENVKNSRFLLLSGTPVIDPMSIYYFIHLVERDLTIETYKRNLLLNDVTEDYTFSKRLIKFLRIYISRNIIDLGGEDFPDFKENFVYISFGADQTREITKAFMYETHIIRIGLGGRLKDQRKVTQTMLFLARTRLKSSQLSNVLYPEGKGLKKVKDTTVEKGGWIDKTVVDDLDDYSPKLSHIIRYIKKNEGKHAIYTNYIEKHGMNFIRAVLEILGIPHLHFNGSMNDKERTVVKDEINKKDTTYKVLIFSRAAAEGQNFLGFRSLHLMEEIPDETITTQIFGRFIRYKSHEFLPKEKRNVAIFRYFGYPKNFKKELSTSNKNLIESMPDFKLYDTGKKKFSVIKPLIEQLNELKPVPEITTI